jgi:hypothetical protein
MLAPAPLEKCLILKMFSHMGRCMGPEFEPKVLPSPPQPRVVGVKVFIKRQNIYLLSFFIFKHGQFN